MSEEAFRWVVAIGVLLAAIAIGVQAFFYVGLYLSIKQIQRRVAGLVEKTEPVLDLARRLIEENRPKITDIANEALEITRMAKAEMVRISELVTEISDRTRVKVASAEAALENAAESLHQTASSVRSAVVRPLREINGVLNGVRAALSALVRGRQEHVDRVTQDEEMFI